MSATASNEPTQWAELGVFVDDSNDGDGDDAATTTPARGGARGYANRTPYFAEVRRVESELAELRATMANWEAQRTAAIAEIEGAPGLTISGRSRRAQRAQS